MVSQGAESRTPPLIHARPSRTKMALGQGTEDEGMVEKGIEW